MRDSRLRETFRLVLVFSGLMSSAAAKAEEQGRPAAPLANPVAAQPLDQLSATSTARCFRRTVDPAAAPPPVAQVPALPVMPSAPPNAVLYGCGDGWRERARRRSVLIADKRLLRAQMGDDIDGWKVAQIEGAKVVLASQDGRFATYRLFNGERTGGRGERRSRCRTRQRICRCSKLRRRLADLSSFNRQSLDRPRLNSAAFSPHEFYLIRLSCRLQRIAARTEKLMIYPKWSLVCRIDYCVGRTMFAECPQL